MWVLQRGCEERKPATSGRERVYREGRRTGRSGRAHHGVKREATDIVGGRAVITSVVDRRIHHRGLRGRRGVFVHSGCGANREGSVWGLTCLANNVFTMKSM